MKRYRILAFDFDTRATFLTEEIQETWEQKVKEQHQNNKWSIKEGLIAQYGLLGFHKKKLTNFIDLGAAPFSVISFHNKFLRQARDAFTIGAYYPSLTATCALGERILNQLVLHLRDDFRSTPEYKKIYRKDSFDNWDLAINTLESWEMLLPNVVTAFRELKEIRNQSLHFNPETDSNDREFALSAIKKLYEIISGQFIAFGKVPWSIPGIKGAEFIKKSYEEQPFVKNIILPSCQLVGPLHTLEHKNNCWVAHDSNEYEQKEITDEEFKNLFNERTL
jgi:hypothetical protein